jgi:glycosyltransferase involved in cell wall biosynthesis
LIIIDGASSDNTLEIINSYGLASLVISEPDNGIFDAWNKAIYLCSGTYVAFIGADDLIVYGSLQHVVDACRNAPKSVHLIAGFNILTRKRKPIQILGDVFDPSKLFYRMPIAHVMSAHSITWLKSIGGFDSSFRSAGDYELLLRASKSLNIQTIPYILVYMEDGGASRKAILPHLEHWRARRKNGVGYLKAGILLLKALIGSVLRQSGLRR